MLILYRMTFHFCVKVIALFLDNSSVKPYLCNNVTISLFLSRIACCILNLADKHSSTLILAYNHIYLGKGWF